MLPHAQALARVGFACFPLQPGSKEPVKGSGGFKDASLDPEEIDRLWSAVPDANIGVATGELSDIAVIDVDDPKALPELEARVGQLPATLTVKTGKGYHLIYRYPQGGIRNSASKLARGVDIRGEGGYIVAPPSLHPDTGERYSYLRQVEPAPFPQTVLDELDRIAGVRAEPPALPLREFSPQDAVSDADKWGRAVLEGELGKVAHAQPGTRNHTLFAAACKVFEAVKGGHIDRLFAYNQLTDVAGHIGLGPVEIEKSLASAWDRTYERHPEERPNLPGTAPTPGADLKAEQVTSRRRRSGFRLLSVKQLEDLPPPQWLIPDFLPEGMTWIVGKPGQFKSFVALDWAMTVAAVKQRPVIYCVGEGLSGFGQRVGAWRKTWAHLDTSKFVVADRCPNLYDPAAFDQLAEAIEEMGEHPALIVIDTFARAFVGGDENSATDVGLAIDTLDRLRIEYGASSLVLHHLNASGTRVRGNTAIEGALDAAYKVERPESFGSATATIVHCEKMKDAPEPDDIRLDMRRQGASLVAYEPIHWRLGLRAAGQ